MEQRKKTMHKSKERNPNDDHFLLLHDNCWVSEDQLSPKQGVVVPASVGDGSLLNNYFKKKEVGIREVNLAIAADEILKHAETRLSNDVPLWSSNEIDVVHGKWHKDSTAIFENF